MTFNPRAHWIGLIGSTASLLVAAFLAPRWLSQPGIQENRPLASAPRPPSSLADWKAVPDTVDRYVADNFPPRALLIGGLNFLRLKIGVSGSDRVIVGRDGWLFYDAGDHLQRSATAYSDREAQAWLEALAGRTEALATQGIVYLVVAPPDKESLLPEHAPYWYAGPNPNRPAALLSRLAGASDAGELVYLHDVLDRPTRWGLKTYSRHDTHWTGLGAYEGYAEIMRRLEAMGQTEGPRPLASFAELREGEDYAKPRDLALMLGVANYVDPDYPVLGDPPQQRRLKVEYLSGNVSWTGPQVIDTGNVGKPVLLMMRDSFSNALVPFFHSHFSRIILSHTQDGTWRTDLIDRFKPDIVISEVVERGLPTSLDPAPPASFEAKRRIEAALAKPHRLTFRKASPRSVKVREGGSGEDHILGDNDRDAIFGRDGDDELDAGGGADHLRGGLGDDRILGRDGDDWISGHGGADTLAGGRGADVFYSSPASDLDYVTDFSAAEGDRVELEAGASYVLRQVGPNTVIEMKTARVILSGVKVGDLAADTISTSP